jgi:lipopolysaccharide export system protein LptA
MMSVRALCIVVGLFAVAVNGPEAIGQQLNSAEAVLMTADDLSFDEDLGTATARGNVEIVQGERILTPSPIASATISSPQPATWCCSSRRAKCCSQSS